MNLMFTHRIAECLEGSGVTANCASPGFTRTRLGRNARGSFALFLKLARPFMASPEEGAAIPVHLATEAALEGTTGRYFRNREAREPSRLAQDPAACEHLWELSAQMCGVSDRPGYGGQR